ncbi:MAG TPA: hypothetical protein V6D09_14800, partial [Leptolyngbyaceae cyanobacterium]
IDRVAMTSRMARSSSTDRQGEKQFQQQQGQFASTDDFHSLLLPPTIFRVVSTSGMLISHAIFASAIQLRSVRNCHVPEYCKLSPRLVGAFFVAAFNHLYRARRQFS